MCSAYDLLVRSYTINITVYLFSFKMIEPQALFVLQLGESADPPINVNDSV